MGEPQISPMPRQRTPRSPSDDALGSSDEGRKPPWQKEGSSADEASFGRWLRRQREVREIDLREIADRTKISLRYLKAMEQDRFDLLPAPVFARGFLREYARYVGLSPDEVVNFYLSAHEEMEALDDEGTVTPRHRSSVLRHGLLLALAVALMVALAVYVAFYLENRRSAAPAEEAPAAAVPSPPEDAAPVLRGAAPAALPATMAPSPEAAAAAVPRAPLEVTLDFTAECWVEALIDGRQRLSELHVQGESLSLTAESEVLLRKIGNAAGVEVHVNGRPFPLDGSAGQVVRDVRIDLEVVEGLQTEAPAV
ncbi:MAG: helix-turn-helix domain-containing protein [Acidobacteriota bacterium]